LWGDSIPSQFKSSQELGVSKAVSKARAGQAHEIEILLLVSPQTSNLQQLPTLMCPEAKAAAVTIEFCNRRRQ